MNNNYFLNKTEFNTTINNVWFDRVCARNKKFTKQEIAGMMKDSINNFYKQEGGKYGFDTNIKPTSCPQVIKDAFFKAFQEAQQLVEININTQNFYYSREIRVIEVFLSK